jgi:hypothetical protein
MRLLTKHAIQSKTAVKGEDILPGTDTRSLENDSIFAGVTEVLLGVEPEYGVSYLMIQHRCVITCRCEIWQSHHNLAQNYY